MSRGRPMVAPTGRLFCCCFRCGRCDSRCILRGGGFLCGYGRCFGLFGGRYNRRFRLWRLYRWWVNRGGILRWQGTVGGFRMTADDTVHNQIVTVADGLAVLVLPCGGNLFLNLLATDRAGAGQHTGRAAGGCLGDDAFIVGVGVLRFLSFCLAASLAAAIVGDIVTAAHPTIPVMAECGQLLLDDFAADRALVLGRAVVGAGRFTRVSSISA